MTARKNSGGWNGYAWIRVEKRYAIYFRDRDPVTGNFRCLWCLKQVFPGVRGKETACLDHLVPVSQGGNNTPHNLVTSCAKCNAQRSYGSWEDWLDSAGSDGSVYERIHPLITRPLSDHEKQEGKRLAAERPSRGDRRKASKLGFKT